MTKGNNNDEGAKDQWEDLPAQHYKFWLTTGGVCEFEGGFVSRDFVEARATAYETKDGTERVYTYGTT